MTVNEICAMFDRCASDLLWQDMAPYFRDASAKLRAGEELYSTCKDMQPFDVAPSKRVKLQESVKYYERAGTE